LPDALESAAGKGPAALFPARSFRLCLFLQQPSIFVLPFPELNGEPVLKFPFPRAFVKIAVAAAVVLPVESEQGRPGSRQPLEKRNQGVKLDDSSLMGLYCVMVEIFAMM
jgi:hypothetical protein